ncbi:hypothetical protein Ciccas_006606 [Cichlidogyrus casuarinus]|uniref:Uncharacterized protein n=1 Tax=Cichlidogyrus casuarinus TaxID=1844966 RepID=A0ABD2Q7Q0_9PLAT
MEAKEIAHFGKSDLRLYALKNNTTMSIKEAWENQRTDLLDISFVERNFAMFRLQPASMFMDHIVETPEYPGERLLSDIGGCVGLWLGASLVTIFELFDLGMELFDVIRWNKRLRANEKWRISLERIGNMRSKLLEKQKNMFPAAFREQEWAEEYVDLTAANDEGLCSTSKLNSQLL